MTDLLSLISRLEAASGPDRDLDLDLWRAFTDTHGVPSDVAWRLAGEPRLTASLDAITALIERALPGWGWHTGCDNPERYKPEASLYEYSSDSTRALHSSHAKAPTASLALCLALVRAKAAQMEQSE